jgi:hypothetical protein
MRKPDESLGDLVVEAAPEKLAEPPRPVTLRFTGKVEVLKPLARWEGPVKSEEAAVADTSVRPEPSGFSWFHRSFVAGGGLAVIAVILASAVFIGIYDPSVQQADNPSEVAIDEQPVDRLLPAEEPLVSDVFTPASSRPVSADSLKSKKTSRSNGVGRSYSAFRSSAGPRVQPAAYPPPEPPRSPLVMPEFVPTTLVIYVEKGEIKTRVEPQLNAGHKKRLTLPN